MISKKDKWEMLFGLYIAILVINLLFSANKKKNYFVLILTVTFIAIMMGCNTYTTDYPGYEIVYNTGNSKSTFEIGFNLANKLCKSIGFTYQQFLFIYELCGIIIGLTAVKRITDNYHYVLAMYLMTAVFMDTCQIRNYMAYMILSLALTYLSEKRNLIYEILVVMACLFHISSVPFVLLPLFIRILNSKKYWMKLYVVVISILCMVVFINGNRIPGLYNLMNLFLDKEKINTYFTTHTRLGFLLFFLGYFSLMFIAHISTKEIEHSPLVDVKIVDYGNVIYALVMFASFALPLVMLNSEFLRYFRFIIFPIIILMACIVKTKKRNIKSKLSIVITRYDIVTYIMVISYSIVFQHYRVAGEVFNNNLIN